MTPQTRRRTEAGDTRSEEPLQGFHRESVRGSGRDKQKNRTRNARVNENCSLAVAKRNVPQPLSREASPTHLPPNTPCNRQPNGLQPAAPTNPIRNTRIGEAFAHQPAPPQPSPSQTDPLVHWTRPSPNTSHHSPRSHPLPAPSTRAVGLTTAHPIAPRMMFKPKGIPKKGLKQSMGLHDTKERKHAYNRFRERVRVVMKRRGEGMWVDWDTIPKRDRDWLVREVTNDPHIPFICEYGEWAILDAGRRTAGSWRQNLYHNGSKQVPENRRYLAENSAKRNPNAPRGARFPARPSKRNRSPTPDNDDDRDDGRIPVLPPGPSTTAGSAGFSNEGTDWNPALSFGYPTQQIPGPSRTPFNGLGHFPQTHTPPVPLLIPRGPSNHPSSPSSGASSNTHYWENPPPPSSGFWHPGTQNNGHMPPQHGWRIGVNDTINQSLSHPVGPGGVGQGLLLEYPSMRNDNCAPRLQGRQLNANRVMNGAPSQSLRLEDTVQGLPPAYLGTWNDAHVLQPLGCHFNTSDMIDQAPSRTHGLNNPGRGLLPGPVHPQQQPPFDQRADTPTLLTSRTFQGSFSAPYRFTPENDNVGGSEPRLQPPNQGPSRVDGDLPPRPVRPQPQPSPAQRLDSPMSSSPHMPHNPPGDNNTENDERH